MNVLHRLLLFIVLGSMALAADEPLNATQAAELVVIPKIDFREASLSEAVEYIQMKGRQLARSPKRLNVIVAIKPGQPRPPVTLAKENATIMAVLKEVAEQAGCEVQGEDHALVIRDKGAGPLPPIREGKGGNLQSIRKKLDGIVLTRADFRSATLRECIEFIVQKAKQLDPDGAGVGMVLKLDDAAGNAPQPAPRPVVQGIPGLPAGGALPAPGAEGEGIRISLQASDIPLLELARYVAGLGELQVTVEKFGILVGPVKTE